MSGSLLEAHRGSAIEPGLAAPLPLRVRISRDRDSQGACLSLLSAALVVYLGLNGGGYDLVVRNQLGLVIWWVVLVGAVWGLLPAVAVSRPARVALALFGGFVLCTAVASTWSESSERSLEELSRVACYLGVLVLAVSIGRDRERAVRQVVGAIASAIVVIAAIALLSRLRPGTFTGAQQTAVFLPGTQGRLAWPLNYWNALAALMALGLPLLLAIASSARRLAAQAVAAGALPIVALCGYLTFSRGGVLAAAGGLVAFLVMTGDRIPKLATAVVAAAGSAVPIIGAMHRGAIENGLVSAAARHQGQQLLVALLLASAGTALIQAGIGLAVRHGNRPRWLTVSPGRARVLFTIGVMVTVAAALAAGAPARLGHAWRDFRRPSAAVLHENALGRFGSTSGNGRYDYWKVAVHTSGQHVLGGFGPGTFELVWLPRAPYHSYVRNAHSLYLETLVEDGIVGLALLGAFLALVIGCALRLAARTSHEERTRAAAVVGAIVAFALSAAVDWVWQVPVLPVSFLLLAAAALAPRPRARRALGGGGGEQPSPTDLRLRTWGQRSVRACLALAAVGSLIAITVPLTTTTTLRQSQAAAASGQMARALSDARAAARIEPGAASAQLQSALVLEAEGRPGAALSAVRRATSDEPLNWGAWLIRSRLEAEAGQPVEAVRAFRTARELNPRSPIFSQT